MSHPNPTAAYVETCCDDENNQYEDDSECVICPRCKEWTCEVKCEVCKQTVFNSSCCG